jgi:hypothetical protein
MKLPSFVEAFNAALELYFASGRQHQLDTALSSLPHTRAQMFQSELVKLLLDYHICKDFLIFKSIFIISLFP